MNRKLIAIGTTALLGVWVYAQTQQETFNFRDTKGNLRLWNSPEWFREELENGDLKLHAEGSPVHAESLNQGLKVQAKVLDALLKNQGKGTLAFEWADLQGAVKVNQIRNTNNGVLTRDLTTEKLRLAEGKDSATTTLSTPFTLNDHLKPVGENRSRVLNIKAGSGILVTTPYREQDNNDIKSADLKAATVRLEQGAKPGEKEPTTSVSTATSSSMDLKKSENYTLTFAAKVDFSDSRKIRKQFGQATQDTTMTGNSGSIVLDDLKADGEQPVVKADLKGSIKLVFESVNPIDGDIEYTSIDVKGDRLTFTRETRTINITGSVLGNYTKRKKSQDPEDVIPYQLRGDEITIVLTEDFSKVKTISGKQGSARTGGAGG